MTFLDRAGSGSPSRAPRTVDSFDTWLFEIPDIPMAWTNSIDLPGADTLDVGFLDDGDQGVF